MNEETALQNEIQLSLPPHCIMFRNNSGAAKTDRGTFVKYGVGPGGSDLIGWTMLEGSAGNWAIFTAMEIKLPGWIKPEDERERRQAHFIKRIKESGGIAGFVTSVEDAHELILKGTDLLTDAR